LGYKITMSTSNNNEYKPTITKGEQYVVSTSSDGKKSYGAILSGKALYSTNSSISNKLSIGCWVTTTNLYKPTFKWLTDSAQIEVSGNGEWSFSTGALEKGQYEFLLSRYYLSEDGKDNWLESNFFHMNVDHPTKFGLIVTILTSCLVFISFIFRISSHRFIHNKRTKILWITLLLGLNIACFFFMALYFIFFSGLFNIWELVILVPLFMIVNLLIRDFLTCQKEIVRQRQARNLQSEKRLRDLGFDTPYKNLFYSLTFYKNRPPEEAIQLFKKNKDIILPEIINLLRDQSPQGKEARIVMHDLLKHFFTNFRPFLSPLPLKYLMLQKQLKNPASEKTQQMKTSINSLIYELHQDNSPQGLVAKQILAQDVEKYIKNNPNIDTDTRLLWAMSSIRPPFQLFPLEDIEQIQARLTNSSQKLKDLKRMKALSRLTGVQRKPSEVSSVRSSRIIPSPRSYQLVPVTTNDDDE